MKKVTLNTEQATSIRNDFMYVVGKSYKVRGENMQVSSISIEEVANSGSFTVVVNFVPLDPTFLFFMPIDSFLSEAGIDFDLSNYTD